MKPLSREILPVPAAYLLLFATGLILQSVFTQSGISLGINHHHHPFADFFFKYITHLGDGIFIVLLCAGVMLKNRRAGLAILIAYIVSALITQGLKHFVFADMHRPSVMLQEMNLYFVEGVEIHRFNSFPSGHSTSAFAAGTMICLLLQNNVYRLLVLLLVLLVCFSRVYLLLHFFQDVLAGSIIGFATAFATYLLFYRNNAGN